MINSFLFWLSCPHRTLTSIDRIKWYCKNKTTLGIDEVPEWQDWSNRATTEDQVRIEAVLRGLDLSQKNLLHVGIGNSMLALLFHKHTKCIDGITIQEAEVTRARAMRLNGYRVLMCNKFSNDLVEKLGKNYDFIIDNNPSAFACCKRHFYTMFKNYVLLLKPGGAIITDKLGLGWSSTRNDPRWGLTPEHWITIGAHFNLHPVKYDESVLALRKAL